MVVQKNPGPLDFTHRCGTRTTQRFENHTLPWRQSQSREFAPSGHTPNRNTSKTFCKCFNETMYYVLTAPNFFHASRITHHASRITNHQVTGYQLPVTPGKCIEALILLV